MDLKVFKEICSEWQFSSWKRGNLLDYWGRGGLNPEKIYENREKLQEETHSIAILGSLGKSTLSRILAALIRESCATCFVTRVNDNWLPQLPLAVELAKRKKPDFTIFECAVASKGDASLLAAVVPAKTIVYTEFSEVHLSELQSLEGVAREKSQFAKTKPAANVISHAFNLPSLSQEGVCASLTYGPVGSKVNFEYQVLNMLTDQTDVRIFEERSTTVQLKDIGYHLGPAVCGAISAYSLATGKSLSEKIKLATYKNSPQHMQTIHHNGVKFIIDTANSNKLSIINSLRTLLFLDSDHPKNAVVGEIYGLGQQTDEIMKSLIKDMCSLDLNRLNSLHLVGTHFMKSRSKISRETPGRTFFYKNLKEFNTAFQLEVYKGQIVLLRGPSKMGVNFSNILKCYDGSSDETSPFEVNIPCPLK